MERAQILCQNSIINIDDLGLPASNTRVKTIVVEPDKLATLETMELDIIDKRLSYFNGNALKAAKSLGLSRSAFYRRLEKI